LNQPFKIDKIALVLGIVILVVLFVSVRKSLSLKPSELLRYEVTWNGNRAGHGDVTTIRDANHIKVVAQAVSDGLLKRIFELWSQVKATFTVASFKPVTYNFHLKTNFGCPRIVVLSFDNKTNLVQVNKLNGNERDCHAEKCSGVCDPITAVYRLRFEKDLTRPEHVDIYDGNDRSRLFVQPIRTGFVNLKSGARPALCLALRLVKLSGDKKEIGTGRLWVSNDRHHIPLLLTSSPIFGQIRFELVQAQL
jgi:Protein of unknown function (DUF3108)